MGNQTAYPIVLAETSTLLSTVGEKITKTRVFLSLDAQKQFFIINK
jgi:hypothetical protein